MSLPSSWFLLTLYFSGNRQKDGVDHICPESHLIFQAECKTGKCDPFRNLTAVWLLNNYCQCYQLCILKSLILISKNLFSKKKNLFSYSLCRCKRFFSQHSLSYRKFTLQRLTLSELNFSQTLYSLSFPHGVLSLNYKVGTWRKYFRPAETQSKVFNNVVQDW